MEPGAFAATIKRLWAGSQKTSVTLLVVVWMFHFAMHSTPPMWKNARKSQISVKLAIVSGLQMTGVHETFAFNSVRAISKQKHATTKTHAVKNANESYLC